MTENTSEVHRVRADFTVDRTGADGHMAQTLRFTIEGGRCTTLSELGKYMGKLIDDYVARLSPDALELQQLRARVRELESERKSPVYVAQTQGSHASTAPIPRAQTGRGRK